MLGSKWLGHSSFTLTLDVYGDYIPKDDGGRSTRYRSQPHRRSPPSVADRLAT